MIPVKPSNNQQNCNPISSNCVTWQGPDIACINLQNGDTVSDVTYKLAVELCDLLNQTALDSFDLSCFDPICPKPENFHDLVQFIIDKLCTLNGCCSGATPVVMSSGAKSFAASASTSGSCPDCIITIAPCFQYTDQFGNNITTMNIADYAAAIGVRVCTLATQFAGLQTTVSNQGQRITNLETWVNNFAPTIPTALSSCLYPNTSIQVTAFCQALEQEFCSLRNATGTPASIITAISRQCADLDNLPKLYGSGLMGMIPGWTLQSNYSTAADAINNLWLTVCDLRAAVDNILNTCCNDSLTCNSTSVSFGTISIATSNLSVPLLGTVAPGAIDCTSGIVLSVSDKFGNTYDLSPTPAIVSNLNGTPITVSLGSTGVWSWSDLDIILTYCIENTNNIACTGSISSSFLNPAMVPALTYNLATPTEIWFEFTNPATIVGVIYYVQLYADDEVTLIGTKTFVNPITSPLTDGFSGLISGDDYKVRIGTQVGTYIRYSNFDSVTAP
jgi:hypothetical protein